MKQNKNTYCHMLWDSVFINYNGKVFICCHSKPKEIGNIYKDNLKKIWTENNKIKKLRLKSLNGSLKCCNDCNLLSKEDKKNKVNYQLYKDYPRRVWLLYGEYCNQNCIMCLQDHKSKVMLDNNALKNQIDWTKIEDIEFQGGEILAMKRAKELYLWLTQKMNKKVNLITNGMLINDEWAEHLAKGSNWIEISVNAATKKTHELVNRGSNYELVLDNIKKLIYFKDKYNLKTEIIYKYTIVKENLHEIADAIKFADALSCDFINVGYDVSVPVFLNGNLILKEKIRNEISSIMNEDLKLKISRKRLNYLGLL